MDGRVGSKYVCTSYLKYTTYINFDIASYCLKEIHEKIYITYCTLRNIHDKSLELNNFILKTVCSKPCKKFVVNPNKSGLFEDIFSGGGSI